MNTEDKRMLVNVLYSADHGHDGHEHDHSHHDCEHCDHEHHHHDEEEGDPVVITMVDEETNEEFEFVIADDFEFEGEIYCVLVTQDDDPEAVIVRVVTLEDGSEGFQSLDEEEFDRVAAEYDRLVDEDEDVEDDEE